MPNIIGATNFFAKSYENTVPMTLGGSVVAGAATVPVNNMTNYTDGDVICFVVDGATPALKQVFTGTKNGSNIINVVWTEFPTGGVNVPHSAGATVIDYVSATHWALLQKGITSSINQDGSLKTAAVQAALNITGGAVGGWTPTGFTPSSVVANGNRSYNLTFSANNLTNVLSPGMRLMTQRTVVAPTQCTSLNGSTQFYSKTAPAGMTFTNNFVASAWVKLTNYQSAQVLSRYDGTSGWYLFINSSGQVQLTGANGGAANFSQILSYQSIPLNKWVHIAAQLDMATFTATPTTSYVMIDGVDVPAAVSRGGTNPTALVQAGTLQIGAGNSTNFFPGKIAQVAIYSAKVTEATILASMHQTLAGTETSLISAYSFNNSINDLNTTNANNLTANGSAVATNPDSPFGGQANGTISSTLDYGIVTAATFSTNTTLTVQVPEGCTIPTSGGVSAVSYATVKAPYGMPVQRGKWSVLLVDKQNESTGSTSAGTFNPSGLNIQIPVGEWRINAKGSLYINVGTVGFKTLTFQFGTSATTNGLLESQATFYFNPSASSDQMAPFTTFTNYSSTVLAPLYIQLVVALGGTLSSAPGIRGDNATTVIEAELAYL